MLHEHEVVGLENPASGPVLHVRRPADGGSQTISARFVLACDGASSMVRKALGITLDDIGFEERWLVVDTFVDGPMRWPQTHEIPDEVRDDRYSLMVCDPARPSTLIPGVGRHRRWEYMLFPGEHPDDDVPEDWLRAQLGQWVDPERVELLRSAVYRFRALVARRWRAGNVFLLGDAAHQTPPFYGQGMCHGIRDAAQLIWKMKLVRDGAAADALLDSYQAEREPHVREIISASVSAGAAVCRTDPAEAAARDAAFRAIEAERAARPVAMTDIVPPLRHGVIDAASGGMRIPEFAFTTAAGEIRRIDDLIDGGFLLIGLGDAAPVGVPAGIDLRQVAVGPHAPLQDRDEAFTVWLAEYEVRWVLVRPDRYVHTLAANRDGIDAALALLREQLGASDTTGAAVPPSFHRSLA